MPSVSAGGFGGRLCRLQAVLDTVSAERPKTLSGWGGVGRVSALEKHPQAGGLVRRRDSLFCALETSIRWWAMSEGMCGKHPDHLLGQLSAGGVGRGGGRAGSGLSGWWVARAHGAQEGVVGPGGQGWVRGRQGGSKGSAGKEGPCPQDRCRVQVVSPRFRVSLDTRCGRGPSQCRLVMVLGAVLQSPDKGPAGQAGGGGRG